MPVPTGLHLHQTATLDLRICPCRNPSNLWTPTSQRSVEFGNSAAPENVIYAGQGPPPPSPMVVERFQQVISQLFQQVSRHTVQLQRRDDTPTNVYIGGRAGAFVKEQVCRWTLKWLAGEAAKPGSYRSLKGPDRGPQLAEQEVASIR